MTFAPEPFLATLAVRQQTLEEVERAQILATLKQTKWILSGPKGAAIRLGLNRSTLQFRMKKLGIARLRDLAEHASSNAMQECQLVSTR